jgi:hypothetical protein
MQGSRRKRRRLPTDITKLQTLAAESVGAITQRLVAGEITPTAWLREMERAIARAHTAAFIAATADRTGQRVGAGLITPRNLSRAERADLDKAVAAQRPYLARFARDVRGGDLSDAQIQARADLYAGPVRATYSKTRWADVNLPAHPADGSTECLAWCKCSWALRDDGYHWELGAAEHCPTCESRAARWRPYRD